jgi:hypothetical protein
MQKRALKNNQLKRAAFTETTHTFAARKFLPKACQDSRDPACVQRVLFRTCSILPQIQISQRSPLHKTLHATVETSFG